MLAGIQAERARRTNGLLDRCELLWQRAMDSAAKPLDTWIIPGDAGPEGYLTMGPRSPDRTLHVEDWAALTPRAGRGILGFLAGWHSQASAITWAGGAGGHADPPAARSRRHHCVVGAVDAAHHRRGRCA